MPRARPSFPQALFAAAWLGGLGLFATFTLRDRWTVADPFPALAVRWSLLWAVFLGAVGVAALGRLRIRPAVAAALAVPWFLVVLAAAPPERAVRVGGGETRVFEGWISDDYHRYLLDGRLLLDGENPYEVVPGEIGADRVNHPDLPSFYPPLAEALFLLYALTGLGWRAILLGNLLAHAASVLVLGRLLEGRRGGSALTLLFALNPLVLVESSLGLHYEPVVVLALLGMLAAFRAGRRGAGAGLWAAAAGLKLFPFLLLPFVARRAGILRTAIATAVAIATLLPFLGETTLGVYREYAEILVNPAPFAFLPAGVRVALVLGVVAAVFLRSPGEGGWVFWPLVAVLLVARTVHPWYVLWILPFALLEFRTRWPALLLSFAVFAAYGILSRLFATDVWEPATSLTTTLWLGFLAALSAAAWFRTPRPAWSAVLLAWPVVPLLLLSHDFESARFLPEWGRSFPYYPWAFGLDWQAPWGLRVLAWAPVRGLAALGVPPVTAGHLLLGAGLLQAFTLLVRLLGPRAGTGAILLLACPYFWTLPWGQLTGGPGGAVGPAWHFSQVSEGIWLPLAIVGICLVRRRAGPWPLSVILAVLLLTKDSAFLLVAGYWIAWERFSLRPLATAIALGGLYVAGLALSGLPYPEGLPTVLPAFAGGRLAGNLWPLLLVGAWLAAVLGSTWRGAGRPERLAFLLYAGWLLGFSLFWEARLWLPVVPLLVAHAHGSRRIRG